MLLWFVQSAHRSNSSGQQWQLLLLQFCTFFLVSNRTEQFSPDMRSLCNLLPSPNNHLWSHTWAVTLCSYLLRALTLCCSWVHPLGRCSPNLFQRKLLHLFYVGQRLLGSILRSLAEKKAASALWGRPLQVLLPWVFLRRRDTSRYVHQKSQQNSPVCSVKALMLSDCLGSLLCSLCHAGKPKHHASVLQTWDVLASLLSALMSLPFR